MNRDQLLKELDNLITSIEDIKSQEEDYKESYNNWETVMQNDIDSLVSEFELYLEKEVGDK